MGIVNFGIPAQESEWLRNQIALTTVVEGGTYRGGTALSLSKTFCEIYTIEKSDIMFEQASKNLNSVSNITLLKGDTRYHFPKIIEQEENILFWLDAHWSGGDTYGEDDQCPLLAELKIIFSSPLKNFAILVDDARLFLAPPPLPHNLNNWPTIKEIVEAIPHGYDLIVHDDVIYITPTTVHLPEYMQQRTTESLSPRKCINYLFSLFTEFNSKK